MKLYFKRFLFVILAQALLLSCMELPVEYAIPVDKVLSVSGLLRNNEKTQKIFLLKHSSSNSYHINENLAVSNAEIYFNENGKLYYFKEDSLKKGEYILENWIPKGNFNYTVIINHKDYPHIEAHTLFPDSGKFNFKYKFDKAGNLLLSWDKIDNSFGYRIDIWKWVYGYLNPPQQEYFWKAEYPFWISDEKTIIDKDALTDWGKEVDLKIIVSALDENYYNYLKFSHSYDPLDFHLIEYGNFSAIDNAVGYIGSAYADSIIIAR